MTTITTALVDGLMFHYAVGWVFGAGFATCSNFVGLRWLGLQTSNGASGIWGIMPVKPFGLLSRLEFLQNWASAFIAGLNPAVIHNLEKYYAIKKVCYLSALENIEGDYLEFGVFTGSSFSHALRCLRKLSSIHPSVAATKCYGFDSFAGFGSLEEEDRHPFYTNENFETSLPQVERRVRRARATWRFN